MGGRGFVQRCRDDGLGETSWGALVSFGKAFNVCLRAGADSERFLFRVLLGMGVCRC